MAVVSAVLILVGRINNHIWWGTWVFAAGIALLVIAGVLFVVSTRR
jgi:hypothetical protein